MMCRAGAIRLANGTSPAVPARIGPLALASDPHAYEKPGRYHVLVKVIDIFGNDTSQGYDVEV